MNGRIDLNCDMGESFGAWTMGQDEALLDLVTSANIACGLHAGDAHVVAQCRVSLIGDQRAQLALAVWRHVLIAGVRARVARLAAWAVLMGMVMVVKAAHYATSQIARLAARTGRSAFCCR